MTQQNDILKILKQLQMQTEKTPLTAQQGLTLPQKKIRQLHKTIHSEFHNSDLPFQDFFFLIVEVTPHCCTVIPGSLNGLMAGPEDVVLPKNILGQYVFLSPKLKTPLPIEALGMGFAMLDDVTFQHITQGTWTNFPHAMPYISQYDDRRKYHEQFEQILAESKRQKPLRRIPYRMRHWAYAASVLFVGTLVTVALLPQKKQEMSYFPESPAVEFQPSGIVRGAHNSVCIYSPRSEMFSDQPAIVLGGEKNKKYTVNIYKKREKIAEFSITSGEPYPWLNAMKNPMEENIFYALEIKDGSQTLVSREKSVFWLMDHTDRKKIIAKMQHLEQAADVTPVSVLQEIIVKMQHLGQQDNTSVQQKAQYLYENGYFADAYILCTQHPQNTMLRELQGKCREKLEK